MKDRFSLEAGVSGGVKPVKPLHSLKIDTNLGTNISAPKSTTNAEVLNTLTLKQSYTT